MCFDYYTHAYIEFIRGCAYYSAELESMDLPYHVGDDLIKFTLMNFSSETIIVHVF
jgi:hypothetical protein